MKETSETLFTTRIWYDVENGSNGTCNFVFNSGPQVFNDSSSPKYFENLWIFSAFHANIWDLTSNLDFLHENLKKFIASQNVLDLKNH